MNEHRLLTALLLTFAAIALPACTCCNFNRPKTSEGFKTSEMTQQKEAPKDRPYYMATPQIQQDIRDLMARVPAATPVEFNQIAGKLAAYGEPAVPQLVSTLKEQSGERSHIMSAYVLGMIKDPRSLNALHEATYNPSERVRFEAATSMLRMNDRRGFRTMIGGLEHQDPLVRARSILILEERTGTTMGYRADARPQDRAAAVSRWRAWHVESGVQQG